MSFVLILVAAGMAIAAQDVTMPVASPVTSTTNMSTLPIVDKDESGMQELPAKGEARRSDALSCSYESGYAEGKKIADEEGSLAWLGIGFAGGCCFNCTGCLGSTAAGYLWPSPYDVEINRCVDDMRYGEGVKKGYLEVKKTSNATNAFAGGVIGTVLLVGLYIGLSFLPFIAR